MKLVFTDEAKADLIQIGDWIAQDNHCAPSRLSMNWRSAVDN